MTELAMLFRMGPWLAILILIGVTTYQSDKIHDWHTQSDKCAAARKADRARYEQAQKDAEARNKAQVRATEEQYKRNNDEAVSSLNDRIARLRRELSARPGSTEGSAGRPGVPQADNPPGTPGKAGVCISPEELLRGAENEERHDQLITLILKQLGAK